MFLTFTLFLTSFSSYLICVPLNWFIFLFAYFLSSSFAPFTWSFTDFPFIVLSTSSFSYFLLIFLTYFSASLHFVTHFPFLDSFFFFILPFEFPFPLHVTYFNLLSPFIFVLVNLFCLFINFCLFISHLFFNTLLTLVFTASTSVFPSVFFLWFLFYSLLCSTSCFHSWDSEFMNRWWSAHSLLNIIPFTLNDSENA